VEPPSQPEVGRGAVCQPVVGQSLCDTSHALLHRALQQEAVLGRSTLDIAGLPPVATAAAGSATTSNRDAAAYAPSDIRQHPSAGARFQDVSSSTQLIGLPVCPRWKLHHPAAHIHLLVVAACWRL
jgi:hypothetical protein